MRMGLFGSSDNLALQITQRGKKRDGAVADIIMCLGASVALLGVWGVTEQKTGLSTGCRQPLDRRDVKHRTSWRGPLHTFPRPAG